MSLPPRFIDLKKEIASQYPNFEQNAVRSWGEVLEEMNKVTKTIKDEGVAVRFHII